CWVQLISVASMPPPPPSPPRRTIRTRTGARGPRLAPRATRRRPRVPLCVVGSRPPCCSRVLLELPPDHARWADRAVDVHVVRPRVGLNRVEQLLVREGAPSDHPVLLAGGERQRLDHRARDAY